MGKLDGKVAVVTGATSGIGLATAELFLSEGAKVVLSGRSKESLDALSLSLSGDYTTIVADTTKLSENQAMIDQAISHYGRIDILFLNAGVFISELVGRITEETFDTIYNTNVKGPLFTANAAASHMSKGGVILFNSSITNAKGMMGACVYGSGKAALRSIVRSMAAELAPKGIRVNAISPGPIDTPLWAKTGMNTEQLAGFKIGVAKQIPLQRFGTSEEVAQLALFLASDDASFITGAEVPIDGGMAQI